MADLPLDTRTDPERKVYRGFLRSDLVIAGRRSDTSGQVPDEHIDMLRLTPDGDLVVRVKDRVAEGHAAWGGAPNVWRGSAW